jgi:hypothetical protein
VRHATATVTSGSEGFGKTKSRPLGSDVAALFDSIRFDLVMILWFNGSWLWLLQPCDLLRHASILLVSEGRHAAGRPKQRLSGFCQGCRNQIQGLVWEMEDSSGWNRIEGNFEKF